MSDTLATLFDVGFFAALIRISTPLLLATIGELYNERAGVLNLGIEGIMLLGAMVGFTVAYQTGSLWLGVLAALVTGALAGLVMALLTVVLGVSQHVSGIGMTLLATGLAFYFYRLIFGQPSVPPNIVPFAVAPIPVLSDIPVLGPILFDQNILTYIALLAVPATAWLLYRTPWGLDLRTVGENPRAADAAGVNVWGMRTQALVLGGALMALGGAYLDHRPVQCLHLRCHLRARLGVDRARRLRPVAAVALRRRRLPVRRPRSPATPSAGDEHAAFAL